jgi:hypothetical protein
MSGDALMGGLWVRDREIVLFGAVCMCFFCVVVDFVRGFFSWLGAV